MAKATRQLGVIHPGTNNSSAPAPLRRSHRRALYGFVIGVAGFALLGLKLAQANKTELVVAVKAPVAAGQRITAGDLGEAALPAKNSLASLPAGQMTQAVGRIAAVPLYPGDILDPRDYATAAPLPAGSVAMTLALAPEQALDGTLRPGQIVAAFAAPSTVPATGLPPAPAVQVLQAAPVIAVVAPSVTAGAPATEYVTLQLTTIQAAVLDAAYRADKIDLALVGG